MLLPQPQAPGGLSKKVWAPFPKLVGVANGSAKRHLGGLRNDGRMIWGDFVHGVVGGGDFFSPKDICLLDVFLLVPLERIRVVGFTKRPKIFTATILAY